MRFFLGRPLYSFCIFPLLFLHISMILFCRIDAMEQGALDAFSCAASRPAYLDEFFRGDTAESTALHVAAGGRKS